ncbi:MAG: AAA family ATPase [Bifidobacteriaceae bacterium]|nr:AAA family ATPase [Bifidobacteriaceae bacterium]
MDYPFLPAFGNRPERLVGRSQEVGDFLTGLAAPPGHRDRATLCLGQRGMGKTALLLEFAEQAERHGFVTAKATASPQLLSELVEGVQAGGAKFVQRGRRVSGASLGVLGFSAGLTFSAEVQERASFRARLSLLCDALAEQGKGVLLLVDEVTSASDQIRQLAACYQELVGEGRNVAIAMAGLPNAVSNVLNDTVLTFLNRARKARLAPLAIPDVAVHYARTFAALGKSLASRELERAADSTLGYPYLLQLVGYYLVQLVGTDHSVTADTVDAAVSLSRRALEDSVFAPSLAPLSRRDRAFLEAMALDTGPSAISQIAQRMGVSPDSAQQTRRRLIAAGVIAPAGTGQVAYSLPYLGEFVRGEL